MPLRFQALLILILILVPLLVFLHRSKRLVWSWPFKSAESRFHWLARYIPLFTFLGAYSVLCLSGSLILLFKIQPLAAMSVQLFGNITPHLTPDQRVTCLWVLLGSPLCFTLGYWLVDRLVSSRGKPVDFGTRDIHPSLLLGVGLFIVLCAAAFRALAEGGAFSMIESWNDYNAWVNARWTLFSKLRFFDFVNIYMWLPTSAALLILLIEPRTVVGHIFRWSPIMLVLVIDLLLYQKKPAVLTVLTAVGVPWIARVLLHPDRSRRYAMLGFAGAAGATVIYALVALAPVLLTKSKRTPAHQLDSRTASNLGFATKSPAPSAGTKAALPASQGATGSVPVGPAVTGSAPASQGATGSVSVGPTATGSAPAGGTEAPQAIEVSAPVVVERYEVSPLQYTILSIMMRGAGPALYYVYVFPDHHPYYHVDVGQDSIFGGDMPNDFIVVWPYMYPDMPGAVAAASNFVLYSQGGISVALAGMAIAGGLICGCWYFILSSRGAINLRTLAGITLLLFLIHSTIDSFRASLIVSYGFGWALLLLFVLFGCEQMGRALGSRGPSRSIAR